MSSVSAPVIVHSTLAGTDMCYRLQQKGCRIRYGTGTAEGSVIFPQGGPVFLVQQLNKAVLVWPPDNETLALEPEVFNKLIKAMQVHSNMYLITMSPLLGLNELTVISLLKERLVDVRILPVKGGRECADAMCNIVKVHEAETRELIEQRLQKTVNEMRENLFSDVVNSLPFDETVKSDVQLTFDCVADLVTSQQIPDHSLVPFFSEDKVTV